MSRSMVIDLETRAMDGLEAFLEPPRPPANYKDADKIAAYQAEKLTEAADKAALNPDLCQIACVGVWEEGTSGPLAMTCRTEEEEASTLRWLVAETGIMHPETEVLTFNGLGFDLPVLMRRAQLLEVGGLRFDLNRYRPSRIVDLMNVLTFQGAIPARSLQWYARRFGLRVDDSSSGRDVAGMVAREAWNEVAAHCLADVRLTRALANRLRALPPVVAF